MTSERIEGVCHGFDAMCGVGRKPGFIVTEGKGVRKSLNL